MNIFEKLKRGDFINEKSIFLLTFIFSITAIIISFKSGNMLAYNDATAHLNTARRIVDNLHPGLVQIGSVWLPLLHLFTIPFVSIDYLWHTGLAGAIVSGASFITASIFLYKLIIQITESKWAGFIGVFAFITNVNLLYLQTTTMFEPLLMAMAFGAVYYLSRWSKKGNINYLVVAAFFTMLATLTRYDGWALFLAIAAYIFIVNILLKRKGKGGTLLIFLVLASFGIFLWLLYNQMIFGDALYFSRSEYSAAAQQNILFERGMLPTKGDLHLSTVTYSIAVILNVGIITTLLGITGVFFFIKDKIKSPNLWGPLVLLVPYFFNIISLYLGQSVIWLPMVAPFLDTYFNARYGLLVLPAAAFFIGYLVKKNLILRFIVSALLVMQIFVFFNPDILSLFDQKVSIITLQDTVSSVNQQTLNATNYIHDNYNGGLIMVSSASADAFIFRTGISLKNFITEGTGFYWKDSLEMPDKYATWLVFFGDRSDRVGKVVGEWPYLEEIFSLQYKDQTYEIWKKKDAVVQPEVEPTISVE